MSKPLVYIETYGCRQNEADSEKILGTIIARGFEETKEAEKASLIIINTCAIREHAELKALSNTGHFKSLKKNNKELVIGVCGCMVQQEHRKNDIKMSYPYVDFVFGTNMLSSLDEILDSVYEKKKRQFFISSYEENPGDVAEDLPIHRGSSFSANVSVMYGCNNFCTYCVVPYVRGRERSRQSENVVKEVKGLLENGYKEIMLLGQNVNSYGKDLSDDVDFSELLLRLSDLSPDYVLRFLTSHPKDAKKRLIDVMAQTDVIERHFHLPLQAGSDKVLERMNRRYTFSHYYSLIEYMRKKIPDIAITTDIIVGFPGETDEDFECTMRALEEVQFDNIYSFIYSPRVNTPAANFKDQIDTDVKKYRMERLLSAQIEISAKENAKYVGKTLRCLVEGESFTNKSVYTARTSSGKIVHFKKSDKTKVGQFSTLKIIGSKAAALEGEEV